jgi:hypothetical protein
MEETKIVAAAMNALTPLVSDLNSGDMRAVVEVNRIIQEADPYKF